MSHFIMSKHYYKIVSYRTKRIKSCKLLRSLFYKPHDKRKNLLKGWDIF